MNRTLKAILLNIAFFGTMALAYHFGYQILFAKTLHTPNEFMIQPFWG